MNPDSELDRWRVSWASEDTGAPRRDIAVIALHRRQQRRLRLEYVLNLIAAVLLIGFSFLVLRGSLDRETLVWAGAVWATTLAATAFHVWNWRGLWRAEAGPVLDFAEAFERRARTTLRGVRFGYGLLAFQLAVAVPWLTLDYRSGGVPTTPYIGSMALLALLSAGFVAWFRRTSRRALDEIGRSREFRRGLVEEPRTGV